MTHINLVFLSELASAEQTAFLFIVVPEIFFLADTLVDGAGFSEFSDRFFDEGAVSKALGVYLRPLETSFTVALIQAVFFFVLKIVIFQFVTLFDDTVKLFGVPNVPFQTVAAVSIQIVSAFFVGELDFLTLTRHALSLIFIPNIIILTITAAIRCRLDLTVCVTDSDTLISPVFLHPLEVGLARA